MVTAQRLIEYPPVETLFDSQSVKAYSGRRAVYCVAPKWKPTVVGTPYTHQYWGLACFLQQQRFLLLADTGLGKTKVALDAMEYAFSHWPVKHALVLTGRPISTDEWVQQAAEYVKVPAFQVAGSPADRRAQLGHFPMAPIMVSDYKSLQTAFTVKRKVGRKSKFVADAAALQAFGRQFDLIVLDEIHQLKNPTSLRFQMVDALVMEIPVRWGLTGTLFDRHPEDAWAQFWLIDEGETLGTRTDFLEYFFDEKKSFWSKYAKEYRIKPERKEEFKRRVRHRALRVAKKECPDIPDVQTLYIRLKPTAEQKQHIRSMERAVIAARERDEQLQSFQFLRQVVSGLLRVKSAPHSPSDCEIDTTVRLDYSPKLEWVVDFLEGLDEKEQVVVFYEFIASGEWLNEVLTHAHHKVSWLYGGVKDEMNVLAAWKTRKTRILLTQTEKAAESLNLQQAHYLIQYESPLTYRVEKQSLARVGGRIGGASSIVYKLAIRGCVEQKILQLIREGKNLSGELLEDDNESS